MRDDGPPPLSTVGQLIKLDERLQKLTGPDALKVAGNLNAVVTEVPADVAKLPGRRGSGIRRSERSSTAAIRAESDGPRGRAALGRSRGGRWSPAGSLSSALATRL